MEEPKTQIIQALIRSVFKVFLKKESRSVKLIQVRCLANKQYRVSIPELIHAICKTLLVGRLANSLTSLQNIEESEKSLQDFHECDKCEQDKAYSCCKNRSVRLHDTAA